MNFFGKNTSNNKSKRNWYLSGLISLCVVLLSVVYAGFSTDLFLNVSGKIDIFYTSTYYYYNGKFYKNESCENKYLAKNNDGKEITTMPEMIDYLSGMYGIGKVYMMSSYSVSGTEVISTNANITIDRYRYANVASNSYSLFSITSTGNLSFIVGDDGYITINGENISAGNTNGGAFNNAGTLTLGSENSTSENIKIEKNSTAASGGGIYNTGTLNIYNSNISNNIASQNGGGIYNSGTCSLNNVTVTGNSVNANSNKKGGGIYDSGTLNITNKVVVNNNTANNTNDNVYLLNNKVMTINGQLLSGTNIGVTTQNTPGASILGGLINLGINIATGAGNNRSSYSKYFFSDISGYSINYKLTSDYITVNN